MHTLLIVDDEEIEREGMAQFIPWDTYKMKVVGTARNGAEGLEKIAKYKPDLAIVDIKMPVMNGIEMIRKAKEQHPDMTFVVLADAAAEPSLENAVQVLKKEFKRFETVNMLSAASRTGTLEELATLFQQVQELLQLNPDENETALLRPSQNAALPETVNEIFDIRALRQAGSYEELLRELALAFARMEAKNYRPRQRQQLCELAWKLLFEGKTPPEDALAAWADALTAAWSLPQPDARSREIFLAIYENLSDPDFSLQTIAQQRLFMSEDHLRRIFSQMTGERFSAYLERAHITQAQRLCSPPPTRWVLYTACSRSADAFWACSPSGSGTTRSLPEPRA